MANLGNYIPDYQFIVMNANTSWIRANRETAVKFLKAIIRADRFINNPKNKEEAVAILQRGHKIDPKYARMVHKMIVEELKPIPNDASVSLKAMETVIQLMIETKQLDQTYPPSMFIDDSLRQEALKRLGG